MPTKNELQRQLVAVSKEASAYQEAFWALQRGDKPIVLGSGLHRIELLAPQRMCGGVIVQGCTVVFADSWVGMIDHRSDPYLQDLARQVRKLQGEAVDALLDAKADAGRAPALRVVGGAS